MSILQKGWGVGGPQDSFVPTSIFGGQIARTRNPKLLYHIPVCFLSGRERLPETLMEQPRSERTSESSPMLGGGGGDVVQRPAV